MVERVEDNPGRVEFPPTVLLYPLPAVMVSCAGSDIAKTKDRPNIITIAWAGTVCSDPPMLSISVRKSRHSHRLISETGEFVVNLVGKNLARACDYCGVKSGADEDKFASCDLNAIPAIGLNIAPAIKQTPLYLSCVVRQVLELGSHDMFIAEIVSVSAQQSLIDERGKICLERAELVSYVHGDYYSLGEMFGFFGFSVASQDKLAKRMRGKVGIAPAKHTKKKEQNSKPQNNIKTKRAAPDRPKSD
ncbi:MAG: flavin reductase family protein [Clostridiaceae bacterium]|nr:flavin reductase family protein [Oscillospiraceae bacterium]NLO63340.1 flavin reductase family protein [Clostridiaceae bacterium]